MTLLGAAHANLSVLVFGDSWGSLGPSWHMLEDMFASHGVAATVKSSAKGGTQACQWAAEPKSLAMEAAALFGEQGPDYVWYTLGGNDIAGGDYGDCSKAATSLHEELQCMRAATDKINACTESMLGPFWEAYPHAKVLQCGYDIPCEQGSCAAQPARNPYCGTNVTCMNLVTVGWQPMLLELQTKYPNLFGIDILGTVQQAGGVKGASTGHPVIDAGSPCDLMTGCVHPIHGKAGATAIGEAFWDLYFSKQNTSAHRVPPRVVTRESRREPHAVEDAHDEPGRV